MGFIVNAPEALVPTSRMILTMTDGEGMTDDQFFEFCQLNRKLRIERTAEGEIIIIPPAGGETGSRNMSLAMRVGVWASNDGRGVAFDSSTGFILPNGATRSLDTAWVLHERLTSLTPDQKRKFLPLCPDFVVEPQSPSDPLAGLKAKVQEYIDNGAQLGWLLVPETKDVYMYRAGYEPDQLTNPQQIAGDPLLPGFVLNLAEIWDPGF